MEACAPLSIPIFLDRRIRRAPCLSRRMLALPLSMLCTSYASARLSRICSPRRDVRTTAFSAHPRLFRSSLPGLPCPAISGRDGAGDARQLTRRVRDGLVERELGAFGAGGQSIPGGGAVRIEGLVPGGPRRSRRRGRTTLCSRRNLTPQTTVLLHPPPAAFTPAQCGSTDLPAAARLGQSLRMHIARPGRADRRTVATARSCCARWRSNDPKDTTSGRSSGAGYEHRSAYRSGVSQDRRPRNTASTA